MNFGLGLGLGAPTPFNPNDIPGLALWLESDFGVATSGSAVTGWTDRKQGFVASQGTGAKRPTYSASDADFNGRPSLAGTTAAATQLTNTTDTPVASGATRTTFLVFKAANAVGGALYDTRHAATGRAEWLWWANGGSTFIYTDSVAVSQTIPNPADFQAAHVMSTIWISGSLVQCWVDSVAQTVSGGSPNTDVAAAGFDIFSQQNAGIPLEGKIAAIIVYTGALTAIDRKRVESYLSRKYKGT